MLQKKIIQLNYFTTKEMIEAKQHAYSLGRFHVAEEFKTFTNELEKKYTVTVPEFCEDRKG